MMMATPSPTNRSYFQRERSIPESLLLPPLFPRTSSTVESASATQPSEGTPEPDEFQKTMTPFSKQVQSIEILLPPLPMSSKDVFLLTDDDLIQHVLSPEESVSCFYISDDDDYYCATPAGNCQDGESALSSLAMSVSSMASNASSLSLLDYEYFANAQSDDAVRIPDKRGSSVETMDEEQNGGNKLSYLQEEQKVTATNAGDEKQDDELLGLGCLSDSFSAVLGGFMNNVPLECCPYAGLADSYSHQASVIMGM